MSIHQEYNDIFDKEIVQKSRSIIFSFSPVEDKYSRYESGILDIPSISLIKLADFYKVSEDYLLGRTDTKN